MNTWAVKYAIGFAGTVKVKEFKTEAAMDRWVNKQLNAGAIQIFAFSHPE